MPLRLYDYAASGNCYKVRLLLAQLGRDYERVPVDIFAGDTLGDDFGRVNPARMTPVLETEDGSLLPESNAILLYLAEGTPFLPDDPLERAQVHRWLFYEQSEVIPTVAGLRFRLVTGRLQPGSPAAEQRRLGGERTLAVLDAHLREHDYLAAGRYTVADISVYAYVHVAGEAGLDLDAYPAVIAWLERVRAQPGHINDLIPYPANAGVGQSRSIYD